MKKKLSLIFTAAGILFLTNACTDLKEQVLDETLSTKLSDEDAAKGLIAPVYALLPNLFQHTTYFALQEISTDEAILPYRGGTDWGDNGIYVALHAHTTTSTDPNVNSTWNTIVQSISRSITAISSFQNSTNSNATLYSAEARGMRAYYNMVALDLFGVAFLKEDAGTTSKILRGDEAVKYIESELLAIEPLVQSKAVVGPGRLNQAAVWSLLARLYMNAPVYRNIYGTSFDFNAAGDMDKVIQYTDKVIASGQAKLSPDYFAIFGNDNHTNDELIFAVDQRPTLNGHNRMAYFSISGDQFPLAAFPSANGTDGPGITPDFYQSWVQAYGAVDPTRDPRFYKENMSIYSNKADTCINDADYKINRGILRGQQYGAIRVNGAFLRCAGGKLKVGKLTYVTRNRADLDVNFSEKINFTDASNYNTGYRVEKYEFSRVSDSGRNKGEADIVIVRLADIYMMRAEAKLRKSNDAAGALADVNLVRASRTATTPPPALTSMNLDLLFRERGFEFYWEMLRRTDMIRFGKYEGTWTEKTNPEVKRRIFPIPQNAIDGASNLPGYLKQNDGY